MNNLLKNVTLLIIIIVLGLGAYGYFSIYKPKVIELNQLKTEQQVLSSEQKALESQMNAIEELVVKSTTELQKIIPTARNLEQVLTELNEIQYQSDVKVTAISLSNGLEDNEVTVPTEEEDATAPSGLKELQLTISVETSNYFDMMTYMKKLEETKRIMKMERIAFNGINEMILKDSGSETISLELLVSTYYQPTLNSITDELPTIIVPSNPEKESPFANFEGSSN